MGKFYRYRQNNTGGYFDIDDNLDVTVIIEANDYNQANDIAGDIGIYFDGTSGGLDCSCCGDRWCEQYDDDEPTELPEQYGMPIEEQTKWIVHYLDGRKIRG